MGVSTTESSAVRNRGRGSVLARLGRRIPPASRRRAVVAVSLFFVFFLAFRYALHFRLMDALLGTNATDFVNTFQTDSDGLVFRRLEQNRMTGIFSGQMGLRMDDTYAQPFGPFYASQFGLGGWLSTLPPTAFGVFGKSGAGVVLTLVAGFNALVASAAVGAVRRTLSGGAAILCVLALLQPWPVAIAHSAYWMIGLKLLPAGALIVVFAQGRGTWLRVFFAVLGVSTFTFLSGYEFATIVVASSLGVVTYYCIVSQRSLSESISRALAALGGCVGGLFAALVIHFVQLRVRLGGTAAALEAIEDTVAKRTGATNIQVDPIYLESLASNPADVLATYLSIPVVGAPVVLPVVSLFTVAALISVCTTVVILGARGGMMQPLDIRQHAVGIAWAVTLLGPVGWFLVARPHSHLHTHINPALWWLPVIPLGVALLWQPLISGLNGLRAQRVSLVALAAVMLCFGVFFAYSLMSMKTLP